MLGGLMFRIRGDRDKALAAVESAVESVDPSLLPSVDMVSLEEGTVALQRGFYRVLAAFAGTLTVLALTLAGVGIYGVMAFLVSQRTREIGIRVALGASRRRVVGLILREGAVMTGVGLALGVTGALALTRLMKALLFDVAPNDPVTFVSVGAVLAIVGVAASSLPALRASTVDPSVTIRAE
jgi:ABC-type antimicrobial peptide transport system permease subunit